LEEAPRAAGPVARRSQWARGREALLFRGRTRPARPRRAVRLAQRRPVAGERAAREEAGLPPNPVAGEGEANRMDAPGAGQAGDTREVRPGEVRSLGLERRPLGSSSRRTGLGHPVNRSEIALPAAQVRRHRPACQDAPAERAEGRSQHHPSLEAVQSQRQPPVGVRAALAAAWQVELAAELGRARSRAVPLPAAARRRTSNTCWSPGCWRHTSRTESSMRLRGREHRRS